MSLKFFLKKIGMDSGAIALTAPHAKPALGGSRRARRFPN